MALEGSCHCGEVTFRVDADAPRQAVRCNCSHCRRKGFLLTFAPASQFHLLTGEEHLREYRFHSRKIRHRFCTICGVQPCADGTAPDGAETVMINLNCVPDIDPATLDIRDVDGASL